MNMAYLAFTEGAAGNPPAVTPQHDIAAVSPAAQPVLSALEWSVVAIARRDRLSSLRRPGRIALAMGALFGNRGNPRLADPRLEALRRIAVLSWHDGYSVASQEVRRFIEAGFAPAQYELVVDSISADRLAQQNERFRR